MSIDAIFWTKHAFMTLYKVELAQIGLWSISIIYFWLKMGNEQMNKVSNNQSHFATYQSWEAS